MVSLDLVIIGSVFYAKRCKDTIFFDELATNKNKYPSMFSFGAIIPKQGNTSMIKAQPYYKRLYLY